MLTKTTETGIQTLVYLALRDSDEPISPRVLAEKLALSPTYLSKITAQLVRANVLVALRGVKGGVRLGRDPKDILLLDIVQALQGVILGNYCELGAHHPNPVCSFHEAMLELHHATLEVLSRWTLADLATRPRQGGRIASGMPCLMSNVALASRSASPPNDGAGI